MGWGAIGEVTACRSPAEPSPNQVEKKSPLWATERVAYYEDGHLCFQSVTAYGTKHYMMQMQCDSALSPAKSTKVITNYNWDAKISIMTACAANPVVKSLRCPDGSKPHRLAFGLKKCALCDTTNPNPNH